MKQKTVEQASLLDAKGEADRHHQAIILRILNDHPTGLTEQAIRAKEAYPCYAGYSFLTEKHLRRLQARGLIESYGSTPLHWRPKQ